MLISKDHLLHQLDGRPEDGWISIKAVRSMIEAEEAIDEKKILIQRPVDMEEVKRLFKDIGLWIEVEE